MVRDLVAKFIYYDDFNLARDEEIFTFLWVKNKEGKRKMVGMSSMASTKTRTRCLPMRISKISAAQTNMRIS